MTLFATKFFCCLRILTFRSGLEEMAKDEVIGKLQDKIKDEILEATIGPMLEELYATLRPEQLFFYSDRIHVLPSDSKKCSESFWARRYCPCCCELLSQTPRCSRAWRRMR